MPTTWNAIYLGTNTGFDIDPIETNGLSENAASLVGASVGSEAAPLYERIVTVQTADNGGAVGSLDTQRATIASDLDTVTYTLPGATTPTTAVYDGIGQYNAVVTFANGDTANVTAIVFQDEAGNFFLAPETSANADSAAYQSGPIVSLTLVSNIPPDAGITNFNLTANRQGTDFITCFVAGTMIDTPEGPRPVQDLRAGDMVTTVDRGPQPLVWTGSRSVGSDAPNMRPVRIRAGALGQGLPVADLLVSQQHRVLVCSAVARRMFGADEVLVAAKQLLALPGIEIAEDPGAVDYVHLLFDRHELILANGARTESLFTGPEALKGVSDAARDEILSIFPRLAQIGEGIEPPHPVRPLVKGVHGRKLAERHLSNDKAVLEIH